MMNISNKMLAIAYLFALTVNLLFYPTLLVYVMLLLTVLLTFKLLVV